MSIVEQLQGVGLTEYEARVYSSTMEYSKCVKCLKDTFEMAWRYSEK